MIYLEKITLIEVTGEEILSFLDIIERAGDNMFQHLITLKIDEPRYIDSVNSHSVHHNHEKQKEYESNIINRILTANNYRLKLIMIDGNHLYL